MHLAAYSRSGTGRSNPGARDPIANQCLPFRHCLAAARGIDPFFGCQLCLQFRLAPGLVFGPRAHRPIGRFPELARLSLLPRLPDCGCSVLCLTLALLTLFAPVLLGALLLPR